jgi:hypothetical protein
MVDELAFRRWRFGNAFRFRRNPLPSPASLCELIQQEEEEDDQQKRKNARWSQSSTCSREKVDTLAIDGSI